MGNPAKAFTDDILWCYGGSEQAGGDSCHILLDLRDRGPTAHGGGGADAEHTLGFQGLPKAPHQHGDIGSLAAPIGMQFIQHQELKVPGGLDEMLTLPWPGENQLEHHIVGQQDIGWVVQDLVPGLFVLLACVPGEPDGRLALGEAWAEEFLHLSELAVGQSVHRVDDNGLNALAAAVLQDVVHDGENIGKALAGPSSGSQDIVHIPVGAGECLFLVPVQPQVCANGVLSGFATAENFPAGWMQAATGDQLIDSWSREKGGIELNQGFWP